MSPRSPAGTGTQSLHLRDCPRGRRRSVPQPCLSQSGPHNPHGLKSRQNCHTTCCPGSPNCLRLALNFWTEGEQLPAPLDLSGAALGCGQAQRQPPLCCPPIARPGPARRPGEPSAAAAPVLRYQPRGREGRSGGARDRRPGRAQPELPSGNSSPGHLETPIKRAPASPIPYCPSW